MRSFSVRATSRVWAAPTIFSAGVSYPATSSFARPSLPFMPSSYPPAPLGRLRVVDVLGSGDSCCRCYCRSPAMGRAMSPFPGMALRRADREREGPGQKISQEMRVTRFNQHDPSGGYARIPSTDTVLHSRGNVSLVRGPVVRTPPGGTNRTQCRGRDTKVQCPSLAFGVEL